MPSAPTTERGWLAFVGSVAALYAILLFVLTDEGPVQALGLGAVYGLAVAIGVALLVVLWRGLPDLLYLERGEWRRRE